MARARAVLSERHLRRLAILIFVSVGNPAQSFRRLFGAVDRALAAPDLAGARCVMQLGNTSDYQPKNAEAVRFLNMEEFSAQIEEADVVVCHAGVGSVLHVLRHGKTPVVMPRRRQYNEHINDHQLQLVETLAAEGRVIPAYEAADVLPAILAARERPKTRAPEAEPMLVQMVRQAIDSLLPRP